MGSDPQPRGRLAMMDSRLGRSGDALSTRNEPPECANRQQSFENCDRCSLCRWYQNNVRLHTDLDPCTNALRATGTCGNEAVHAEVREALRQVYDVALLTFHVTLQLFE